MVMPKPIIHEVSGIHLPLPFLAGVTGCHIQFSSGCPSCKQSEHFIHRTISSTSVGCYFSYPPVYIKAPEYLGGKEV